MAKVVPVIVKFKNPLVSRLSGGRVIIDNSPPNPNRGFAAGVNRGIKKAIKFGATHVLLINPDVFITESAIQKLLRINGDIVSPILKFQRRGKWIYDFGGKVNWIFGRTVHIETASDQRLVTSNQLDYVSGACLLIKRNVFGKIGLFDERFFMYFEDVDFCLRARKAGFKIAVDPAVTITHNLTKNKQKIKYALESNLKFINKWVPWYFRPTAHIYWFLLWLKTR